MEHIQVIADDCQIHGAVDRGGDFIAEKIVGCIHKGAILADENPDRTRLRVEYV